MADPEPRGEAGAPSLDGFLADARERAERGTATSVTIRGLLRRVGAERRGPRVVEQIQDALDRHGLVSVPSFASGWVDNRVQLRLAPEQTGTPDAAATSLRRAASQEVSLTVRNLESATAGVTAVERNSDLLRARALMLRYDYSQLAVMSGPRQLVGAVSWESMALAALRRPEFALADAIIPARVVGLDDDLIALIPTIAEEGFVFVANRDRTMAGIITTADLSLQFATLAGPFLVLGEIERRLRQALSAHFDPGDLAEVRDPSDTHRTIDSANDLTLGETLRFLERPARWERLGWPVDRAEFVAALNEVKDIRNEVMHFSPDPLSRAQEEALFNFVSWLRAMEAPGSA
jgi:predicted transcriptional regulator